jgi:hypothetical protein
MQRGTRWTDPDAVECARRFHCVVEYFFWLEDSDSMYGSGRG